MPTAKGDPVHTAWRILRARLADRLENRTFEVGSCNSMFLQSLQQVPPWLQPSASPPMCASWSKADSEDFVRVVG